MDLKYSRAFQIIFYGKLLREKSYKRSTPHLQIRSLGGEISPRRPKTLSFSRREEELLVKIIYLAGLLITFMLGLPYHFSWYISVVRRLLHFSVGCFWY